MHLETFTASSGHLSARVVTTEWARHLHSTVAPEREHEYFGDLKLWGGVVVLAGTGLGYHLTHALKTIPRHTRLVVIDFFPELVTHVAERCLGSLPNPVTVIAGPDVGGGRDRLATALAAESGAHVQVVRHPASFAINRDYYHGVLHALERPGRAPAIPRPQSTALLMHGSFFLEEELRNAFTMDGAVPGLFAYGRLPTGIAYESALQKAFQRHKPDFLVSVNMKGFDGEGILSEWTSRLGIPVVVWFVDDPRPILLNQRRFVGSHMIAACWERAYLEKLERAGFGEVRYLPLAADPALFRAEEEVTPRVGTGFVGSSMGEGFLEPLRQKFLWRPELHTLAERAARLLLADRHALVEGCIDQALRELDMTLPFSDERNRTWFASYVIHWASHRRRIDIVKALVAEEIELFGDPDGWRVSLGDRVPLHPDIDYRTRLRDVYRSIAVNLNITSSQMPTGVNQRVFDIPLSGGFVLCDEREDLLELFDAREVAYYTDRDELLDKVRFYRANPAARTAIASAARERILGEHTYAQRVARIREWVTGR